MWFFEEGMAAWVKECAWAQTDRSGHRQRRNLRAARVGDGGKRREKTRRNI